MTRMVEEEKEEEEEETYTVVELAEMTGLRPRTIRHYSMIGLLTKPPFRRKRTV